MSKICPNCGNENSDQSAFCLSCGNKLNEMQNTAPNQQNMGENTNFTQPPTYSKPVGNVVGGSNKKLLFAVIAIAVIAVVASAGIFLVLGGEDDSEGNNGGSGSLITSESFQTSTQGPVVNLQSLASGNLQSIPAEGYTAVYGMYYQDEKVGEVTAQNVGIQSYNGITCYKIIGESDMTLTVSGYDMATTMDFTYYVRQSNMMPLHMTIDIDYSQPSYLADYDMSMQIDWDHSTGEMVISTSVMGNSYTMTSNLPMDYWDLVNLNSLSVGQSESFDYTMSMNLPGMDSQTVDISTTFTVTGIEDVTVAGTTYQNCYVLEMEQNQQTSSTSTGVEANMKIWLTSNGIVPKAQTTSGSGVSTFSVTQILEDYYIA